MSIEAILLILGLLGMGVFFRLVQQHENAKRDKIQQQFATRSAEPADDFTHRVLEIIARVSTDATGLAVDPPCLRMTDRIDTDLGLGLDSLAGFDLEASLSKEFQIHFTLDRTVRVEPTIHDIIERIHTLQALKARSA